MTYPLTKYLCAALISIGLLPSCTRPTAYFQPSSGYRASQPESVSLKGPVNDVNTPTVQLAQATMALSQIDAYVRSDRQLATNEKLHSHLNRARKLLASAHETRKPDIAQAATKKTLVERLMLRKINRQMGKQLAPNHPEKALLANRGQLIGGLVLLVGGLILLIAGTGTAAFIGLILALIGALGVILGFFGQ